MAQWHSGCSPCGFFTFSHFPLSASDRGMLYGWLNVYCNLPLLEEEWGGGGMGVLVGRVDVRRKMALVKADIHWLLWIQWTEGLFLCMTPGGQLIREFGISTLHAQVIGYSR